MPKQHPNAAAVPLRTRKAMYEAFREYTEEAISTLVGIMRDEDKDAGHRIAATKEILARGYGAVPNVDLVEVAFKHEHEINLDALKQMSDKELADFQLLLTKLVKIEQDAIDADVIEHKP